jgi:UPF0755 protein
MRWLRAFAIVVFLVVAAGFVILYVGWEQLSERIEVDTTQLVQIPRGASPSESLHILTQSGVLKYEIPLRLYMKLIGAGPRIKAGDYYFPSPISALGVLYKLEEGGQGADKITVIEGWNRWDIAAAMTHIPTLKIRNADEILKLTDNARLIEDLDAKAKNLEGFLFPDTYFVYSTSTDKELIEQMVSQFRTVWQGKLAARARALGRSVHDVVTIGSIIETEAKLPEERPVVASVIYNRLAKNMTLSVDSTIVYASKLAGKWKGDGKVYKSDIDRDTPYNTRKYHGLPPGPVGSPSLASMEAAINPANTVYLYYVRNPKRNDGAHNFYTNPADFEVGVKALRDWEQKQKKR